MTQNYTIIDDFLPSNQFNDFINIVVKSQLFPWRYSPVSGGPYAEKGLCDELYNFQFVHMLYWDNCPQSEYYYLLQPFLNQLGVKSLIQAKINFNPITSEIIQHCYHIDTVTDDFNSTTAVYYLNTCDGYTAFETGERIESVANRIVYFPCNTRHTGTTCTNQQGRYVLNINYF
jgi:hypothetical protein